MLRICCINMKVVCIVLCWFLIMSGSLSAQNSQPLTGVGVDFYDEALRLFGTASTGGSITENRALQGNRIIYHKNGNLYPDERAVRYFSLDYADKQAGDFSVRFDAASDAPVPEFGFMPGPYQQTWNLSEEWILQLWLKGTGKSPPISWPLTFIDQGGNKAVGYLKDFFSDNQWHQLALPLSSLKRNSEFDFSRITACQFDNPLGSNGKLWFDNIHFRRGESGQVIGVTDKTIDQRRAEADASRADRVKEAFLDISQYTPETLKQNMRHVYWRDLLNIHFGKLWLGQDIEKTNAELREIFTSRDSEIRSEYELDGHWSLYLTPTLIQMYYTFGSKAIRMPGRLEKETEEALLELLWERTKVKNDIVIASQSTWWMAGSENHDINAKVANLLSSQIFMQEPAYADRVYPDLGYGSGYGYGHAGMERQTGGRANLKDGKEYRARDHYEAWVVFWDKWFKERADRGPFIEINSPTYMLYSLGFLQCIHDLCDDQALQRKAGKFFDMVWADWAQDQIGGIRGGAKTRSYGPKSGYGSMTQFAKFLFGGPGNACHGFFELLLSDYRLPPLIWELALDREGLGSFAYLSRRPGEEENVWPRPLGNERTLLCNTPGRFLRYSWVTPDYVLGTQMDHPGAVHSHLSVSRRSHSMIFTGDPYCRVIPGPLYSGEKPGLIGAAVFDETDPDSWKPGTDHYYRSVQHRRVMITQQSRNLTRISPEWFPDYDLGSKPYGILFDGDFDQREEKNGWIFVAKGSAYLAARVIVSKEKHTGDPIGTMKGKNGSTALGEQGYLWNSDHSIVCLKNKYSPIIFEAGRKADYPTLKDFQEDILDNPIQLYSTVMAPNLGFDILIYKGCGEDAEEIIFNSANSEIPTVGGEYIDYSYPKLFDSPYLESEYESGIIKIRKDDQELVLDFNRE
jgi:hypothetical protein